MQYFLKEIWGKLPSYENIELIIAGRGLSSEKIKFMESFHNVKVVGEVEKLEDFYENIDISLIVMLKKCGIINRVLDGFSFNVPVLCRPESLLAFNKLPDCCYTYNDCETFLKAINTIKNKPQVAIEKANMALIYVKEFHDWGVNYKDFSSYIN